MQTSLLPGQVYHIFNRGNNREPLFFEECNYEYFLELYARHIYPIAETYAYCLLSNHFHFLLRIRSEEEAAKFFAQGKEFNPSRSFSNLFNAYAKAINKAYGRRGSLFQKNFKHNHVPDDVYFMNLIYYIHFNPQKHGYVSDFKNWKWSSYQTIQSNLPTRLKRQQILEWFGGIDAFTRYHQEFSDHKLLYEYISDDD